MYAIFGAVALPFDGPTVTVVTPGTLYRMKKDTVCLKDRADAALLRRQFGSDLDEEPR